ncbi:hypothetical protein BDP27DRAFT_1322796 [Rhodocollybia butyracea]|uniref:Uncharacterized protein n=1 Tax=Rhodocollybia butyracea TaxID=206335 RepID=A0A9P5PXA8_9AGAR|nr:hypothetical protein BDP27DRAFT_1322796 [Rhodocollybia butyracea]
MVHADIPQLRVNIPIYPLVSRCETPGRAHDLIFFSNRATTSTDTSTQPQPMNPSSSSSSLLSSCTSVLSSFSSSNISSSLTAVRLRIPATAVPSRIPATAILALLDLLDEFDKDVASQVAHVKDSIAETRDLVKTCRAEHVEKQARAHQREAAIEKGTLAADSEFWCSI